MKVTSRRRALIFAGVCSAAAVVVLLSGCGSKTSVVLEEKMHALAVVETNSMALQAWADAGARADVLVHIDGIDDITVFPAAVEETMKNAADHLGRKNSSVVDRIVKWIENGGTVNLGHGAGMYDRVIWVIPASGPLSEFPLDEFRRTMISKRGYPEWALRDLALTGKQITGSIAGIPLTITALKDLELSNETALLDIDLSYFTGRKNADPGYTPGTASLLDFLKELRGRRVSAVFATINRATQKRKAALDIRFLADIIYETLTDPTMLNEPLPEKFEDMIKAEKSLVAGDFGAAEKIYSGLVAAHPSFAGFHFSHAFTLGFLDRGEECREAMQEAQRLDSYYLEGFFQLARLLGANGHVKAGELLIETPELKEKFSRLEIDHQWGLFYVQADMYLEASKFLETVATNRKNDFAVRTVLCNVYEELGDMRNMPRVLTELIKIDRSRVERDMPWVFKKLGDLALASDLDKLAAEQYTSYLALFPDDKDADRMRKIIEEVEKYDSLSSAGE